MWTSAKSLQAVALVYILKMPFVFTASTTVDLTGPGCDQIDGYYLQGADDVITLYAYPEYNTIATRDHCDVTVRADAGRRIQYIIETIFFNECGVDIRMYDNPTIDTNPIQVITCSDNSKVPIQGKTGYNVFRLRLRRTTPESRAFTFAMRMKNDLGPPISFEQDAANYKAEILEPSAIAGIAIAGGIIILVIFLVAIFLCVRARKANTKRQNIKTAGSSYREHSSVSEHQIGKEKQYPPSDFSNFEDKRGTWRTNSYQPRIENYQPPRRPRPPVPMPTQPAPRDPGRKGLSDRHRSGENSSRHTSQTRTNKTRDSYA